MKRRVFDSTRRGGQVFVTYEPATDTFRVATRPSPEATWGPPLTCIRWDDDPPGLLADPTTSRTDAEQAVIDAAIEWDAATQWGDPPTGNAYELRMAIAEAALIAAVDRLAATEETTT